MYSLFNTSVHLRYVLCTEMLQSDSSLTCIRTLIYHSPFAKNAAHVLLANVCRYYQ
ncbi:hypothetical protein DICPUDRAFT_156835 [Dictyostelium purpureum]|uniref:Uncharacterized protein n=1 Tax=Dictyostelium purpureum TaxID=5786 RepID=F0ZXJ8_DICPU|nr:uncharacterized protein DICPUDRAFT_156835 [Dictyostelium purpureum]EGC31338.1 hypothetical protein DICPUDRAFT_156835 [Dictyostelium purpureum]|eukprot:XP_003292147.1 hypothetical protein DICPUDRAFT_156835 [Dictyostelium purpureum]